MVNEGYLILLERFLVVCNATSTKHCLLCSFTKTSGNSSKNRSKKMSHLPLCMELSIYYGSLVCSFQSNFQAVDVACLICNCLCFVLYVWNLATYTCWLQSPHFWVCNELNFHPVSDFEENLLFSPNPFLDKLQGVTTNICTLFIWLHGAIGGQN